MSGRDRMAQTIGFQRRNRRTYSRGSWVRGYLTGYAVAVVSGDVETINQVRRIVQTYF